MGKPERKTEDDAIRELIEAEEKPALDRFRASHFEERLEQRIKSASGPARRPSLSRAIPRPVWVLLAALILLGGALLTFRFRRTPASDGRAAVEAALRQLPGMQAIEKEPRPVSDLSSPPTSLLEKGIIAALSSPNVQSGAAPIPRRNRGFVAINPRREPLDLEELYNILVVNKSVERVLTLISQKSKEG
jgi:hypothetical protein